MPKPRTLAAAALAIGLATGLAGCASPTLEDYAAEQPKLDLREYLDGPLKASGVVFGYDGKADLRFVVDMTGAWEGDTGTLTEHFRYADGRTDERVWTIRFSDDSHFTATADDVVGVAEGGQSGAAATMSYRLKVPRGDGEITLSVEDWFFLQEDGSLINRSTLRKYGLPVGELVVAFRKPEGM